MGRKRKTIGWRARALGALVLVLTQSDLVLMKFSIGAQYVIQGLIVLVTVCLVAIRPKPGR